MPSPPAKKFVIRRSTVVRWMLGIVLFAGLLAGGVWLWIRWDENQGRKAWEAYQAEAVQRGVKFEIGEFVRPPIASADNFAASPLFRRSYETGNMKFPYFVLPAPEWPPKDPGKTLNAKLENTRQDFVRAKWLAKNDTTPAPAALWRALQRFEAPWALLVEAAAKPDARFDVGWENGYTYALGGQEYLRLLSSAARFVEFRAQIRLAEGKPAEALTEWRLLWRLAEALKREPALINWTEKWGIQVKALDLLSTGIDERMWSAAELEAIEAVLAREDVLADFVRAYASERALLTNAYLHFHESWLPKQYSAGVKQEFTNQFLGIYHGVVRHNRDIDFELSTIDVARRRVVKNGERWHPQPAYLDAVDRRRYLAYDLLSLSPMVNSAALVTTRIDQARVASALERYRLAKSAYPADLAALVPEFLAAIPHDVFDGAPLRYRREGETFVLYSIGPDERDDGGRTERKEGGTTDWGWKEWVGKGRKKK